MPVESTSGLSGNSKVDLIVSSLPQTVPTRGSIWPASTSAWMKFGSSRTSGFSVRTQSPFDSAMAWFCAAAKPIFSVVVDDPAAILELLEDVDRAVGGGVVDDDDLFRIVLLGQHGFEASLDEPAAVVGHYRDGDEVVVGHARLLEVLCRTLTSKLRLLSFVLAHAA